MPSDTERTREQCRTCFSATTRCRCIEGEIRKTGRKYAIVVGDGVWTGVLWSLAAPGAVEGAVTYQIASKTRTGVLLAFKRYINWLNGEPETCKND
jgi:hypothetical protein